MLSDLFAGKFDRYFEQASRGTALWLFVHVPKTAGSSLEVDLATFLKPFANISIDYTDTTKPYQVLLDEAVQRFIATHQQTPYQGAGGHIIARHTQMVRQMVPDVRCFSMLRNPINRLISDYRYQRSDMNLARDAFIRTTPDFDTYVARKHVHNKTAIALVPRNLVEEGNIPAAVTHLLENYTFIGLQEMYPLCVRALTTLMGNPRAPEARVRINTAHADQVVLTPDKEAELRRLNAVDFGLFNAMMERWKPIRDDLRAYLAQQKPAKAA